MEKQNITIQTSNSLGLKGNITKQIFNLYFIENKSITDISNILKKDNHYITNIIHRLNNKIELLSTPINTQISTPIKDTEQDTKQNYSIIQQDTKPLIQHIEQDLNKFIPISCEDYLNRKIEDSTDLEILKKAYNYNMNSQENKRKINLMIEGETQTGKTLLLKHFCFKNKIPYIRLNCNGNTTLQDLIGGFVNGGVFCYGYLSLALKYGGFLVIDEINLANSEVLSGLNSIFDNDRTLIIQETGEKIKAHKNFFIAITLNPAHYEGRKLLSEDFKARFNLKFFFDYDIRHEKPLIQNKKLIPFIEQLRLMRTTGDLNKPLPISLFIDFERDLEIFSEKIALSNMLFNFEDTEKQAIKNQYELLFKKSKLKAQDTEQEIKQE